MPFTGDLSDFGPVFFNSIELAVEEINENGGVLGQPIELVRGDSGTAPQQAVQEARRLIEVERVHAIIGPAASGVTLPVAESVTGPGGVLQISPSATSPAITHASDRDFLFRTTISDAAQGAVLAALARERGFNTICTLYVNNAYGQGLSEQFAAAFTAAGGQVLAQVPHEGEQATYASEIGRCEEGNPDGVIAASYPESARVYLREAVERGRIQTFLFVDGTQSDEMFADLGWEHFEGMFGTAPGALDTAIGQGFDQRYQQKFGERPARPFMRESYDALYVIALGAQRAGTLDSAAIRDALRDISNPPGEQINPGPEGWASAVQALGAGQEINYQGAASPVNFDENGDVLTGAIEIWTIEGGQIRVVETREVDLAAGPASAQMELDDSDYDY